MTKNGAPVTTSRERVRLQTHPDGTGTIVGNNTLVWRLPGNVVSHTADESYRVQIDHVYISGVCRQFDHTVTSIDPADRAVASHRVPVVARPSDRASLGKVFAPFPDSDTLLD